MARNDKEMQHWRQESGEALFGSFMFPVLYPQDFVQSLVLRRKDGLGEVRSGDLHIFDVVKVCAHSNQAHWNYPLIAWVGFLRSNDYSRNDCTSNWKAILLSKVVVGRGYKLTGNQTSLTAPPAGYDSVSVTA